MVPSIQGVVYDRDWAYLYKEPSEAKVKLNITP